MITVQDSVASYMSLVGFFTGLYALWISDNARTQNVKISKSEFWPKGFKITNESLRPIPINKVLLILTRRDNGQNIILNPEVRGITIPGNLPPEQSFEIDYSSALQIVETVLSKKRTLEVHTQTGKVIRKVIKN